MWNTLLTLLLGDILLPKTFYNSALQSRFVCFALFRLRIFSSISSIFKVSSKKVCLLLFSCSFLSNSLTPHRLLAHHSPLSMAILQARMLEWVAMLSCRGSSWPRDGICVHYSSCIAGGFFTAEPKYILYTWNNFNYEDS